MNTNTYFGVVSILFALIGVMHVLRIFYGWEAVIGGVAVPFWASWVAVFIAFFLAWQGFQKKR